jgi:prophage regulatory protein
MSEHPAPVSRVASGDAVVPRLISLREVMRLTSLGRSTLYDLIRVQRFPAPLRVTERRSAWVQSEIVSWIQDRIRNRDAAPPANLNC